MERLLIMNFGITLGENGRYQMNGEDFYGYGVNAFPLIWWKWNDRSDNTCQTLFPLIKKYNIPFVRMPLSGYLVKHFQLYLENPEEYFAVIDEVLDEAEKHQIGIIAYVFGNNTYVELCGDKASAIGDVNSRSQAFIRKYMDDVIRRYAGRRCIWGWEITNECNLFADVMHEDIKGFPGVFSDGEPNNPNGYDYLTSEEVRVYYEEVAKIIRRYDTYRIISNGNGDIRPAAKAMYRASQAMNKETHMWEIVDGVNTRQEFYEMNAYFTPDPLDTMCYHMGNAYQNRYYNGRFDRWGEDLSYLQYLLEYKKAAELANKGLYFGEFGDFDEMLDAEETPERFCRILDDMMVADIQLASLWQFRVIDGVYTLHDLGGLGFMLSELSRRNLLFQQQGNQNLEKAWY